MDPIELTRARRRRTRLMRILVAVAAVAALVVAFMVAGRNSTPDDTKQRVEADFALTFPNIYAHREAQLGKSDTATINQLSCGRGTPTGPGQGPGKDWLCEVQYTTSTGRTARATYELFVHGEACYTATDPERDASQTITDHATGVAVPDLLFQFDGCFNVYDDRTSTT